MVENDNKVPIQKMFVGVPLSVANIPMVHNPETPTSTFEPRIIERLPGASGVAGVDQVTASEWGYEYSTDCIEQETAGLSCFVASPRDPFLHKAHVLTPPRQ